MTPLLLLPGLLLHKRLGKLSSVNAGEGVLEQETMRRARTSRQGTHGDLLRASGIRVKPVGNPEGMELNKKSAEGD